METLPPCPHPLQPNAATCNLTPALKSSVSRPKGKPHPDEHKQDTANKPYCRIWKQRQSATMIFGFLPTLAAFLTTLVIATLCIAWAPFAALICARIARHRGLSAKRHAIHGAIYATLLFLPWRHLTRQMRGDPITRANIADAYTVAFIVAALALAAHISFILMWWYSESSILDTLDFIITSTISALTLLAGLLNISLTNKRLNQLEDQQEPRNAITLPNISYIAPFAWAWASMLISSAPWAYRIISNTLRSPSPWFIS